MAETTPASTISLSSGLTVENDRHHPHDHHTAAISALGREGGDSGDSHLPLSDAPEDIAVDAALATAETSDVEVDPNDPEAVIEAALRRLPDDVGAMVEPNVLAALASLHATDLPTYLRLRHKAKQTNRDFSVVELDKAVRRELPSGGEDDPSEPDELGEGKFLLMSVGEDDVSPDDAPDIDPSVDPVGYLERMLIRLQGDVGVLAEEGVVHAFSILRETDMPAFLRMRHLAKMTNRDCSVTTLDKLVRLALPGGGDAPSVIDELVALARAQCELAHDADRHAVAIIPLTGHREVWRVDSSGFEAWLRAAYWQAKQEGVPETTLRAALATIAAAGINDGELVQTHLRAAVGDGGYYIDLGDEHWRAIHVTPSGWQLLEQPPVLFTRAPAMRPLPEPERTGAGLDLLWQHTNIPPALRVLVLAWLIDGFRPDTPFPVLELVGEQGSAKSTTQAVLRSLLDPNKVMLRGRPKSVEDVFVAAANNWLVSYENLSSLTAEQQDAFCTLATGGGFAARQLYTNGEEHILETKRPVALNGIAVVATRPDLIDRVIHVDMPVISAETRKDDADTHAGWERDRPKAFAAVLDAFAAALAMLPTVSLSRKQRMADYERLGEALARALGYVPGEFQAYYAEMVRAGIDRALESNPVAQALEGFLQDVIMPWQGTAAHLFERLERYSNDRAAWPRSPKGLSDQLRRIAPAFRAKGIEITYLGHTRQGGQWRISNIKNHDNA